MPLTFPAHPGLVAGLKLRFPRWIDGTALCIGASSPDFAYAFGDWMHRQSHTLIGLVVWAIPFTVVATALVRWRAAAGVFAHLPDMGPLRARSFRVLSARAGRPRLTATVVGVVLGTVSHVAVDGFTHTGRWGADWLGLNDHLFDGMFGQPFTPARVLQYVGHSFGSLAFIVLLLLMARGRRLEAWYGEEQVEVARRHRPPRPERLVFWAGVLGPTAVAAGMARTDGSVNIFLPIAVLAFSTIAMGCLVPSHRAPVESPRAGATLTP